LKKIRSKRNSLPTQCQNLQICSRTKRQRIGFGRRRTRFCENLLRIVKTRFEDAVTFEFNISDEDKKGFVVPLSLQLLLENSIKHNFATSSKPLNIKIFVENQNLIIENNLQTRELPNKSTGVGLANIVSRYNLLTNRNVFVEKSEDFFRVKLPILKEK
jgi:LytS/YehU family sensor histidine kinase